MVPGVAIVAVGEPTLGAELADRQVLDDPLLHVVETGVIGVEHRPGLIEVEAVLR